MKRKEKEFIDLLITYCAFKPKNDEDRPFTKGYNLGANDVKAYIENHMVEAGLLPTKGEEQKEGK